jgi:hypothetical protein
MEKISQKQQKILSLFIENGALSSSALHIELGRDGKDI